MQTQTIPKGFWPKADGTLVPTSKVSDVDKDRSKTVADVCEAAKMQSAALMAFKTTSMQAVNDFVDRSLSAYDVKHGGAKGNVTLVTFDGRYKIIRQMQGTISFDERLQAAKLLIDECVKAWSKGSNDNIKVLVNDAFQVDSTGKISTGRVLGLRRLKISDDKWLLAMQAISDSIQPTASKPYIRFYERDDASGEYVPISLDVAAI